MPTRKEMYDLLAVVAASLILLGGMYYAYVVYVFDATTFVVSVAAPLILGFAILYTTKNRVLLYSFLALFWAMVDDRPVFFDSVLTWPEVTRFHPFLPRLYMNIFLHAMTLIFLYLALREPMKQTRPTSQKKVVVAFLGLVAFGLAYAQNIPLAAIQNAVFSDWYAFDFTEKVLSVAVLYLAVRKASSGKGPPIEAEQRL